MIPTVHGFGGKSSTVTPRYLSSKELSRSAQQRQEASSAGFERTIERRVGHHLLELQFWREVSGPFLDGQSAQVELKGIVAD